MPALYRNNKTGGIYTLVAQATDTTNATDGRHMVIYSPEDNPEVLYVREAGEFAVKFTQVK